MPVVLEIGVDCAMGKAGAMTVDNPAKSQRDTMIMQDRLAGLTMRQIGLRHGLDASQVCRILNQDEIKESMEQEARVFVSLVPHAVDVYKDVLLNELDRKVKLSAAKDVMQSVGIQPAHTQSIVIQNSFNRQSIELSGDVVDLLGMVRRQQVIPPLGLDVGNSTTIDAEIVQGNEPGGD
jgi:hypothetical protein